MNPTSMFGTSEGLSSNISITISHKLTHTMSPADPYPAPSLSAPPYVIASEAMPMADQANESHHDQIEYFPTLADPNTPEPILEAGRLIEPGSASLERQAVEEFDEKPKVTVAPIHKRPQINNSASESDNNTTSDDESETDMISEDEFENNMTPDYESATNMTSEDESENSISEDESDSYMLSDNLSDHAMIIDPPDVMVDSAFDAVRSAPGPPQVEVFFEQPNDFPDVVVDGAFDVVRSSPEPPQVEVFIQQPNGSYPNACVLCNCKEKIDEFMKDIIENVEGVAQGTLHFRLCPSVSGYQRRWSA
ncbi:uncharacterized protein MELLADRAFT_96213 [Melampsora larici-populina 98AG31]|uniref:Uncharacterized protein n=1 Tax=Melampsora larici-populina (strain 98AG31 / pathotype 3-4-7) TaxID=747676 RepID=F4SBD1_MELLP|nr:uncharacterized protein MELLADRAFT_96213 [Melampsora larici-populina 98AG31]EGF98052.1 hypothetical protein MELLADRAFT_96213 [Melampsora larici-populina 98AG31]